MPKRRLLKDYIQLFQNPGHLFPGGPDNTGAEVILFPNGKNEIWIKDKTGNGFTITASRGPVGFGLTIRRFVGSNPISIMSGDDDTFVELCQYDNNPKAHAFKDWYLADSNNNQLKEKLYREYEKLSKE